MTTQFFIPMRPPTTTHNAKELHAYMKGGKPCAVLHDSSELKAARAKLHAYLAPHAPEKPIPCSEIVEKFWADICGVFVQVEELA